MEISRAANLSQPLPDGYSKKGTSYRRPMDAQPAPAYSQGQVQAPAQGPPLPVQSSNPISSNSARPIATAPAGNGGSRVSSHRRRQSQQIPSAHNGVPADPLPAAPDVPRGPPPTSYRDPYAPKGSSRVPTRSHSGRSRDPTIHTIARQQPNLTIPAERLQHLRSPPYQPVEPLSGTVESSVRRDPTRRPSVPDRSPLQKLEGKLDDISKEERRARILEIELAAQEKVEAEMRARRAREAAAKQQRVTSGPIPVAQAPTRTASNKRHVSMPARKSLPDSEVLSDTDDEVAYDLTDPWDPSMKKMPTGPHRVPSQHKRAPHGSQEHRHSLHHPDPDVARQSSVKGKEAIGAARGSGSFRDRTGADQRRERGEHNPVPVPTGLGLYGVDTPGAPQNTQYQDELSSKELASALRNGSVTDRKRDSRGILAAQKQLEHHQQQQHDLSNGANGTDQLNASAPNSNRRSVGFADELSYVDSNGVKEIERNLPDVFALNGDPDRRYIEPPMLDEWKNAPIVPLVEDDLDLDTAPRRSNSVNKAWWEESTSARRRRSSSAGYAEPTYDGYADPPATQTTFNPPLYLKCGPLLRYTGLRKDKTPTGKEREIWRGSVMIVTADEQSSYEKPPVLRLFKQPMDLLPPPPAEVRDDSLHPAYVDPLEGQVKVSRTGKTLYTRPIAEIPENEDISRIENDSGLFSEVGPGVERTSRIRKKDGEKLGKVREIPGIRLHMERGVTFWRFNLEVELGNSQARIAYRINRGPAIGFWVPGKGETMNVMFHSCNGFSLSVDSKQFCGPDPMWRDVLNSHQTRPFHVMLGGGDQIYNDAVTRDTTLFRQWSESRNAVQKSKMPFSAELQNELEQFYLDRYCMWFSQGLFGMANSQIPMVNIWDDHDIIDGYGSYSHAWMQTPVFTGLGAVAYKYYLLFQHQSVVAETEKTEPSWIIGAQPGPYINQKSRSVFMHLGRQVAFVGMDCRTERRLDEIITEDSYDLIFDRIEAEVIKGETKHLVVMLGVPIAYPRLNFLENVLTSRVVQEPIRALGRAGVLGGFVNKFDGGIEILDDLDDHWTARHHKEERGWLIRELQHIAKTKSVRVTILGGDVHLAAIGQFYSNKKLGIAKDKDHRYMPNVISSAIVNTPPPEMMADIINKRNKVHHLDAETDEHMIPIFSHDVDGKKRNNNYLLQRRNWCSLREWKPGFTPPASPNPEGPRLTRTLSNYTPGKLVRRMSEGGSRRGRGPPLSYYNNPANAEADERQTVPQSSFSPERPARSRRNSISSLFRRRTSMDERNAPSSSHSVPQPRGTIPRESHSSERPSNFHRRPSLMGKRGLSEYINLQGGLDICLNLEVSQNDPAGITAPYRLIVPALDSTVQEGADVEKAPQKTRIKSIFGSLRGGRHRRVVGDDGYSHSEDSLNESQSEEELDEEERARQSYKVGPRILVPSFASRKRASSQSQPALNYGANPPPVIDQERVPGPADRRQSMDTHQPVQAPHHRSSAWESVAAKRHSSAPVTNYDNLQTQTMAVPSRSNSNRQPNYNSSHKSQLPAPTRSDELGHDEPKAQRRSMGGILNQHRGERFEHDAHVAAHTPARSKRDSYPPHPAIVGAGPGSPYARGHVQPRNDSSDGYFGHTGRAVSAGVGAKYLGQGRYADSEDEDDDDDDDDDSLRSYMTGDEKTSRNSFVLPKKKKWQIWK